MDKTIEEKFVKNFIVKDKRERTLHELLSKKKRANIMQRLYDLIDRKYAVLEKSVISDEELLSEVKKYFNTNNDCYVISDSSDDGQVMPFKQAFENMMRYEVAYAIICNDTTALIAEEYNTYGTPFKMLLHR